MLKQARTVSGQGAGRKYSDQLTAIARLDQNPATRAAARAMTFACPGCERIVVPVVCSVTNPDRLHAQQSHFRLKGVDGEPRPMRHFPGCRYYVEPVVSQGRAGSDALGTPSRRLAPSTFVDDVAPDPVRSVASAQARMDGPEGESWASRGHRRYGPGAGIAESRVHEISALAGPFHFQRHALQDEPLAISGCTATTYGSVFRRVDAGLARSLPRPGARFIYWFQPTEIQQYGPNLAFPLRLRTPDGLPLRVYLKQPLDDGELPAAMVKALQQVRYGQAVTLYVLGTFDCTDARRSLSLTPRSVRHVHVEQGLPTG